MVYSQGIRLKKEYGQHFLRDPRVVEHMIAAVSINAKTSVFEVGPGDGFLTRAILQTSAARLWSFEIDAQWAQHLEQTIKDQRFQVILENFLDVDFATLEAHRPWTVLANLPYLITFPILHRLQEHRHLLHEGVIMVQEEVAQKIVKTSGRGYGYPSLFFQHYFEWRLLDKVPPTAFYPAPKVFSRLLYFKPRAQVTPIEEEPRFWEFIRVCFKQPRRTLFNNLRQSHYDMNKISPDALQLRAQQMTMSDLLAAWDLVRS